MMNEDVKPESVKPTSVKFTGRPLCRRVARRIPARTGPDVLKAHASSSSLDEAEHTINPDQDAE
jgi:hypothetical protein